MTMLLIIIFVIIAIIGLMIGGSLGRTVYRGASLINDEYKKREGEDE